MKQKWVIVLSLAALCVKSCPVEHILALKGPDVFSFPYYTDDHCYEDKE